MALQVWLPLNKDLRNVGINNASPINHGGTINNSGMIGKCYEFAGTWGKYLDTGYGNGVNAKNISVCLWVKPLSSLNDKILLGVVGDSGINKRLYLGVKSNTYNIAYGSTTWGRTSNAVVTLNEWQHLCIVVKNRTAILYLNGNLTDETRTYNTDFDFQTNIFIGGRTDGFNSNILVNDVRIYDNALTEEDVKRIYQQKLFEFYPKECKKNWLNYANVKNEYGWRSYGFGSKGIGEVTDEVVALRTTNRLNIRSGNTDNVIKITTKYSGETTSASEIARGVSAKKISDNEFMTFSFYAKGEGTSVGRNIIAHVYSQKEGDSSTVSSTGNDYKLSSEWKRYSHSFKWTKGGTTNGLYNCYIVPYLAKNEHVYVCNFQFEEGSGTTEYNNSMNERDLIFEKSGFLIKNDLVCSGVTFSGNSAVFNGTSDIIRSKTAGLNISGGTLSIWFLPRTKPSGNGTIMFLDGNSRMAVGLYNNADYFIVSTKISVNLFPASDVVYGSWNHICVLYGNDRVATNCYLNGIKLTPNSSKSNWSETESIMKIGAREIYNSYFDGAIKNIKIFKKQLSEEEILELYRQNGN